MATLVTRSGKGSPLTHAEVDANFTNLNTDKLELSGGTMTGNLSFGDNDKAIFGAGSDLQIYHNGFNSYVSDNGTGSLNVTTNGAQIALYDTANSQQMVKAVTAGAVELYYNGAEKLETTSTGVDITGTLTSDGLTVDGGASGLISTGTTDSSDNARIALAGGGTASWDRGSYLRVAGNESSTAGDLDLVAGNISGADVNIYTGATFSAKVANNGDISFYEDTGTTAKFFWDASAESLGIGTSSPSADLNVASSNATIHLTDTDDTTYAEIRNNGGTLTIGSDVGEDASNSSINFRVDDSEAMRIDSSGNLLVGKTASDTATDGTTIFSSGYLATTVTQGTANSGSVAQFRRGSTDGSIVNFLKDGTTVGSIGANVGDLTIGTGNVGLKFNDSANLISAWDMTANAPEDGVFDLGYSNGRFKDLYLSGGVYLGGTGSANKLDDYEEGTFTPTITGGVTGTASGSYTKIGNTVHIRINLYRPTDITSSTDISIGGLPFTSSNLGYRQICNILMRYYNVDEKIVSGYGIEANTTTGKIVIFDDSGSDYQYLQNSAGSSSFGAIRITGSYQTDA